MPSTTIPVTHNRDIALYDWLTRHREILTRHDQIKPDLIFIGDSLIHYWSGEPAAPISRNQAAWDTCFEGFTITNMGFGWDRTENVLWRINHGEIDDIAPRVVLLKIGTNNLGFNPPDEIVAGIEAVVDRIRQKLPASKILVFGILPRLDHTPVGDVNRQLAAALETQTSVHYCDIGNALLSPEGTPDRSYYLDDVHLNEAGYARIALEIRNALLRQADAG